MATTLLIYRVGDQWLLQVGNIPESAIHFVSQEALQDFSAAMARGQRENHSSLFPR